MADFGNDLAKPSGTSSGEQKVSIEQHTGVFMILEVVRPPGKIALLMSAHFPHGLGRMITYTNNALC